NEVNEAEQLVRLALESGLERLEPWPEHRQKLAALAPYNDETTRTLESAIKHMTLLAEHLPNMPAHITAHGTPGLDYKDYKQSLTINIGDLDRGRQGRLKVQSARLKLYLESYRRQHTTH